MSISHCLKISPGFNIEYLPWKSISCKFKYHLKHTKMASKRNRKKVNEYDISNRERRLGIYARQSKERENSGSIEDQIKEGESKAKFLGIPFESYIDRDVTGANDSLDNRPSFLQLLDDIQNGLISEVFCMDESRLTRSTVTKEIMKRIFIDFKIKLFTKLEGEVNFDNSDSEMMSDIRTLFNKKYVKDTSKKIKIRLRNRVEEGKAMTGIFKAYGYTTDEQKNLIINEQEAEIVREMYQMSLEGKGSNTIAKILNERGIQTRSQQLLKNPVKHIDKYTGLEKFINPKTIQWSPNTVLSILKRPLYKGIRQHMDEDFHNAPIIINSDLWEKVQVNLKKNKNSNSKLKHEYLLNDLCYCGRCGNGYKGRTRVSKRDHVYYCTSKRNNSEICGNRGINIDYLNELVWKACSDYTLVAKKAKAEVEKLNSPNSVVLLKEKFKTIQSQIQLQTAGKTKVIGLVAKGLLTDDEVEVELTKIKENLANLNEDLLSTKMKIEDNSANQRMIDEVFEYQKMFTELAINPSNEFKKEVINALVDRVIITYNEISQHFSIQVIQKYKGKAPLDMVVSRHNTLFRKDSYYNWFKETFPINPLGYNGHIGYRVMWRTEWSLIKQRSIFFQLSCNRMNFSGFQCFLQRKWWQYSWHTFGKHCFSCAWRTNQDYIMTACCCYFQCTFNIFLSFYIRKIKRYIFYICIKFITCLNNRWLKHFFVF